MKGKQHSGKSHKRRKGGNTPPPDGYVAQLKQIQFPRLWYDHRYGDSRIVGEAKSSQHADINKVMHQYRQVVVPTVHLQKPLHLLDGTAHALTVESLSQPPRAGSVPVSARGLIHGGVTTVTQGVAASAPASARTDGQDLHIDGRSDFPQTSQSSLLNEYKGKTLRSILGEDYKDSYILHDELLFKETGLVFDGDDYIYAPEFQLNNDDNFYRSRHSHKDHSNQGRYDTELAGGNPTNQNDSVILEEEVNKHFNADNDQVKDWINEQGTFVDLGGEKVKVVVEDGHVILKQPDDDSQQSDGIENGEEMAHIREENIRSGVEVVKLGKKSVSLSRKESSALLAGTLSEKDFENLLEKYRASTGKSDYVVRRSTESKHKPKKPSKYPREIQQNTQPPPTTPTKGHKGDNRSSDKMSLPFDDKLSSASSLIEKTNEHKLKQLEPVPRFSGPPEKQPNVVCFDYEGTTLTHKQVLIAVKDVIGQLKDPRVISIQFVGRNVQLGTMWLNNRWLITLGCEATVNVLLFRGITLKGNRIKCLRYDTVRKQEYEKFLSQPPDKKAEKERKRKEKERKEMEERSDTSEEPNETTL